MSGSKQAAVHSHVHDVVFQPKFAGQGVAGAAGQTQPHSPSTVDGVKFPRQAVMHWQVQFVSLS